MLVYRSPTLDARLQMKFQHSWRRFNSSFRILRATRRETCTYACSKSTTLAFPLTIKCISAEHTDSFDEDITTLHIYAHVGGLNPLSNYSVESSPRVTDAALLQYVRYHLPVKE